MLNAELWYVSILNELAGEPEASDTYQFAVVVEVDEAPLYQLFLGKKETQEGEEYNFLQKKVQFNSAQSVDVEPAELKVDDNHNHALNPSDAW